MAKKTKATRLADYKSLVEKVKSITNKTDHQPLKTTQITGEFGIRNEAIATLVDMKLLSRIPDPEHGRRSLFRWEHGANPITDKMILSIYEKVKNRVRTYIPVSEQKKEEKKAVIKNPVKKDKLQSVNEINFFNCNHLQNMRKWPIDKPTDVQIETTDTLLFANVTELNFNVEGSDLTLDIIARDNEGNISAMSKITLKNVCLKFSHRGPANAPTASLNIEVIRL